MAKRPSPHSKTDRGSMTVEEIRNSWPLCLYDDATVHAMMVKVLLQNDGEGFFRLLENCKEEAEHNPVVRADIEKMCTYPAFAALLAKRQ
jgi:hypothetical protein